MSDPSRVYGIGRAMELPIGIVECDWRFLIRLFQGPPFLPKVWFNVGMVDRSTRSVPMFTDCHSPHEDGCMWKEWDLSYKFHFTLYKLNAKVVVQIQVISKPQLEAAMEGLRKDRYAQTEWWQQPQHGAAFSFSRSVANWREAKVLRFFVWACFGPVDRFWDPKSWSPIGFTELTGSQEIICTIGPKSWDPEAWAHKARKFVDGFEAKQSILP